MPLTSDGLSDFAYDHGYELVESIIENGYYKDLKKMLDNDKVDIQDIVNYLEAGLIDGLRDLGDERR